MRWVLWIGAGDGTVRETFNDDDGVFEVGTLAWRAAEGPGLELAVRQAIAGAHVPAAWYALDEAPVEMSLWPGGAVVGLARVPDRVAGLLTPRQLEICRLLPYHSRASIARALGIAGGTLEVHVRRIRQKVGARSSAELLGWILRNVA